MATIDDLKQELISLGIDEDIINQISPPPNEDTLKKFINNIKHIQGVCEYIDSASNHYSDDGIYETISTLISEQSAKDNSSEFFDPNSGNTIPTQNGKTKLITGIVSCVKDDQFNGDALETLLENLENLKPQEYDTVVIPLGIKSGDKEGGSNHAISLIVNPKTKEMLFVDQAGKDGSEYYVNKLKVLAKTLGYKDTDIKVYSNEIMENKHDCAIFTAYINDLALKANDINALIQEIDQFRGKTEGDKRTEIDRFNGEYKSKIKDSAEKKLIELYENNPLFIEYLKKSNITDFSSLELKEQIKHIRQFANAGVLSVGENTNQANMSDKEKEDIIKAIEYANNVLGNKFEQSEEDPNFPGCLVFKDADKPENRIIFASKSQAFVEGEQKAFDELVVVAQNLGKTKVNFGKFESKPQDKAKLYLACLKYGLETTGHVPTDQELQASPEWPQIEFINATNDISKTFAKRKELEEKIQDPNDAAAKERADLVEALKKAREDLKNNLGDPAKEKAAQQAVEDAKQKLENNPLEQELRAAQKAHEESIKKVQDIATNSPAKDEIKNLPQYAIVEFLTKASEAETIFGEYITLSKDSSKMEEWEKCRNAFELVRNKPEDDDDRKNAADKLKNNEVQKTKDSFHQKIKELIDITTKHPELKEQIESLPQYGIIKLYEEKREKAELFKDLRHAEAEAKKTAQDNNKDWNNELNSYLDALQNPQDPQNQQFISYFTATYSQYDYALDALAINMQQLKGSKKFDDMIRKYNDPKYTGPQKPVQYNQKDGSTVTETDEHFNARKDRFNFNRMLAERYAANTH